jgi:hypothetical protein
VAKARRDREKSAAVADCRAAAKRAVRYSLEVTKRPLDNLELIRRVLGSDYLDLSIRSLELEEDLNAEVTKVVIRTSDENGHAPRLDGEGCGLVDALYGALLRRYGPEYQSLESIELTNFDVSARFETKKDRAGADAVAEVSVDIRNSEGKIFTFVDASRSITTSTARAVLAAVEYFINAERAFITLFRSLKDAQDRGREDLVTRYTRELAEVVKSTSYAEVIENIKRELA